MNQATTYTHNVDDYIDTTIVFGEINKTIISKDFKGGSIHNIFGATELDFSYADISGVVVIDVTLAFGELKLRVPANWRVETDVTQFCAAIEDKRRDMSQTVNTSKILVITGMSAFAAIKIKGI